MNIHFQERGQTVLDLYGHMNELRSISLVHPTTQTVPTSEEICKDVPDCEKTFLTYKADIKKNTVAAVQGEISRFLHHTTRNGAIH